MRRRILSYQTNSYLEDTLNYSTLSYTTTSYQISTYKLTLETQLRRATSKCSAWETLL